MISDAEEREIFYEKLNSVQEGLPKGDTLVVKYDLNAKVCSDNTLFGWTIMTMSRRSGFSTVFTASGREFWEPSEVQF